MIHKNNTCLTDNLLLEVECGADYGDGIIIEVTTVLTGGGVHVDKFLQF